MTDAAACHGMQLHRAKHEADGRCGVTHGRIGLDVAHAMDRMGPCFTHALAFNPDFTPASDEEL
ncbi:hypothetical protein BN2476_420063 [Paraburkholderia piptadeniae]|uniref:Uncharacterized protein n=1 Tax=Paraburkholderia piptadeniae TaxID=1701573 RepID=A0A1N7SB24_9BURK|nr:hypothetical protein [Paraburkholderia piptadeniae]SIT44555.1 hypothetical protein BN2476_420063 [Paraburkholderia piptadeniae]